MVLKATVQKGSPKHALTKATSEAVYADVLQNKRNIHKKTSLSKSFVMKLQALQPAT